MKKILVQSLLAITVSVIFLISPISATIGVPTVKKVYRYYNPVNVVHRLAQSERAILMYNSSPQWIYEEAIFSTYEYVGSTKRCSAGVPVIEVINTVNKASMYVIEGSTSQPFPTSPTYTKNAIVFCAMKNASANNTPVYEFYTTRFNNYAYTANEFEKEALLKNPIWKLNGVAFYVVSE